MGGCCASDNAPDPRGTVMPDKTRWGPFNPKAVEYIDPSGLFAQGTLEILASGFRKTDGPVWDADAKTLYFSDTINAQLFTWTEKKKATMLVTHSGGYDGENVEEYEELYEPGSTGMALDGKNLYICQHSTRRVIKTSLADIRAGRRLSESKVQIVADETSSGKNLNSPDDVAVSKTGEVFFTDPCYGFAKKQHGSYRWIGAGQGLPPDQPYLDEACDKKGPGVKGVYCVRKDDVGLVTRDLQRPNGIGLSKDNTTLWVSNSDKEKPSWTGFAVAKTFPWKKTVELDADSLNDQTLLPEKGRPGSSSGFKVDEQDRLWCSVPGGIAVIDPVKKEVLAKVMLKTTVSNLTFGSGPDIFITGMGHLWKIKRSKR